MVKGFDTRLASKCAEFCLIRNDRKRGRGGGTCIYVNCSLEFELINNPVSNKDIEIQSILLRGRKDSHEQKSIVVILVYRPPNGNGAIAYSTIKEYIGAIEEFEKKEIVIMGDLNWDILEEKGAGAKYINEINEEFGLKQMIGKPTRITNRSNTLIDIILTNIKNVAYAGCVNYQISDHCPVYLVKKRISKEKEYSYVYRRSFRSYDIDEYQQHLSELDWSLLDLLDVNEMWQMIINAISYEAALQCPFKWMKIDIRRPIWYTSQLCEIARDRDILFRNYRRGNRKNNDLYTRAVEKRNEFNRLVKSSRDSFYKEQLSLYKYNQMKFWQTISDILGAKSEQKISKVFRKGKETVEHFKYLGIFLDNKLQFQVQLNSTVKNVNNKLHLMSKIRRSLNQNTALTLYKAMVLPYLEYASCFLMGCNQAEKLKLQRLQNRGLKIALNRDRLYGTEQLHEDARLAYWDKRTKAAICKLIFKYKYSEGYVMSGIETRLHDGPVFHIDTPKTDWYARSVSYVSRNTWNSLPSYIRLLDNQDEFKRAIKRHFTRVLGAIGDERRDRGAIAIVGERIGERDGEDRPSHVPQV